LSAIFDSVFHTSRTIGFAGIFCDDGWEQHYFLNINFLEPNKMSKGNSRKGNRETKKPKKETPKVLATASTISHPGQLELGSKKRK